MARKTGQFDYPYNYEVKLTAPLDSRALVDTVDSLTNSTTWADSDGGIYIYNGLLVSVTENNSVYMLTDADNYTNIESWKKINDDTVVLDYTVNVTYSELVELRDNNQLVPGQLYRITDYVTTTTQVNTESAKHNFDIIVKAISENTLSENASVCRCFNSKRDHGVEINSDIFNYTDENDWYNYGHAYGGPTLPDDVLKLKNEANIDVVSTDYGKFQISDVNQYLNKIFRITLQGTDVNGNKIRGFGATLIKNSVIQDFDFGFRDEFYLRLPESATTGEYVLRFYAIGTQSDMNSGYAGARAEVFDFTSHFNNSDLNAWEIKYSLDNDTNRFVWADTVNGKGVIYYMKDEFGNEAPYDFKNIQFLRNRDFFKSCISAGSEDEVNNLTDIVMTNIGNEFSSLSNINDYFYTFTKIEDGVIVDGSLNKNIHNNKIQSTIGGNVQRLNNTIFIVSNTTGVCNNNINHLNYNNTFCRNSTSSTSISCNIIDTEFQKNIIVGANFYNNNIENFFQGNLIFKTFYNNNVGKRNTDNVYTGVFYYNHTGDNIWHFKCAARTSYCKFGSMFQYNSIRDSSNSGYIEMQYCKFGDGINGCDNIPILQNVEFEDKCWYSNNTQAFFGDLKTSDGTPIVNLLDKEHDKRLYVHRISGSDLSSSPKYIVYEGVVESSEIFIGTFDNMESVSSKAAEVDICTNTNITRISFKIDNDGRRYANGFIEQFISGGPYTVNNTEFYYISQTLYFDGETSSRQIIYKFIDGIKTIQGVGNWYKIIDHDDSNTLSPTLYSKSSEVVNINSDQTITGVKNFNNDILIGDKTRIKTDIWDGEFKVLNKNSNKGFIIRNYDVDNGIKPLEILATNTESSLTYKFPKTGGQISLGISINGSNKTPNLDNGIIDLGTGYTKAKSVTYSELVELRDNGQLVPGQLYRITDYITTTTQINTQSAGHSFDILVEALTNSVLSENVKAYKKELYQNVLNFNASTHWIVPSDNISKEDELNPLLKLIYGKNFDLSTISNEEKKRIRRVNFTRPIKKGILEIIIRLNDNQTNAVTCLGANITQSNKVIYSNYKIGIIDNENKTITYQLHVPSDGSYIIQIFTDCINENYESNTCSAGSDVTLNAYCCDNFVNNDLNAWEIKYCLDNDTSRFAWADPNNGKGVIYYMKDEFNNEAWYDFKNIMFLRNADWFTSNPKFTAAGNITQNTYFYTFSRVNGMVVDDSLGTGAYPTSDNHLGRNTATITKLNNTIFIGNGAFNNVLADGHGNNTIGVNIWNNIIGHNFTNNIINKNFQYNTIKEGVSKNHIWGNFLSNILESNCSDNRFLGNVDNCLFKQYYEKNNFTGDTLSQCTFGIANNWISDMPSMKNVTFSNNCITGSDSIYLSNLITTNNISLLTELNDIYNDNTNFTYSIYQTNNDRYIILSPNIDKNSEIKLTYSELVYLRNNRQLVPGQLYRITDYVTTTTQDNTKSAEHQFDIIVEALTTNTLSEYAKVKAKENDNYFFNNDLNAWKIKYCLDNDTDRFSWADPDNGKGVIYYMKDEYGNEAPYDFKNILYLKDGKEVPTFGENCSNNIIKEYKVDNIINLPNITFGSGCTNNTFGNECYNNTFAYGCTNNTFGNTCTGNTFVFSCTDNTFGNECCKNTFKLSCVNNTIGDYCYNNTFGNRCSHNTFKYNCHHNTFGDNYINNTFGDYCNHNTIGDQCYRNTFGDSCKNNTFGDKCKNNTFGDNCTGNTFGNECYNNTFGEYCNTNTFESGCTDNTFGTDCDNNTFGNYCNYNVFGEYCNNNTFVIHCDYNTFRNECHHNTFRENCNNNTFGKYCNNNTFDGLCDYITFGTDCDNNTFEVFCSHNTFGGGCRNNTIGTYCDNNTFGDSCKNNTFGTYFRNNTFGNTCTGNTFGGNCSANTFENKFNNNTFGDECNENIFGSDCNNNTFGELFQGNIVGASFSHNKIGAKYSFNKFGNNCNYIQIKEKQTSNIDDILQNFNFGAGLTGEIELKGKNIRNRLFETKVCYNSNGDIVQYCEADLVMVNPYEEENNTVTATTTEDSIELTGNIEVGEDEITITGDNIKIINVDNNNYEIIIE